MDVDSTKFPLTAPEQAIADAIKAVIAAGGDPYGDDDPLVDLDAPVVAETPAAPAPAVAETPAAPAPVVAETPPASPAPAPVDAPVVAAASPAPAPADAPVAATPPSPTPVEVAVDLSDLKNLVLPVIPEVDTQAHEAKISDLEAKIEAVEAKFENGELDAAAKNAALRPLRNELRKQEQEYASDVGEARALVSMARATTEQVFTRLRAAGAAAGLDYGDGSKTTLHAHQFNLASQMVASDPRNAALTWVEKAALADNLVRAQNGIALKPAHAPNAAPAPAPAAQAAPPAAAAPVAATRTPPPPPPNTIRDLPPAARPNEQSDTIAGKIAVGDAIQRDAIWKAMTKEQRAHALGED